MEQERGVLHPPADFIPGTDSEDSGHNPRERWSHLVGTRLRRPFVDEQLYRWQIKTMKRGKNTADRSKRVDDGGPGKMHLTLKRARSH